MTTRAMVAVYIAGGTVAAGGIIALIWWLRSRRPPVETNTITVTPTKAAAGAAVGAVQG